MAKVELAILVISSLLLLSSVSAYVEAPAKKPIAAKRAVEVVVEGMVYCQSCKRVGTGSLTGAVPLPLAKVSVTCKNQKGQVSFYKAYEADKTGYFYAELEGYVLTNRYADHPLQACKVKLVASPDQKCSLFSNVNNGLSGAPLRYEDKTYANHKYKAVIYAAGPLAFRPNHCPLPTRY